MSVLAQLNRSSSHTRYNRATEATTTSATCTYLRRLSCGGVRCWRPVFGPEAYTWRGEKTSKLIRRSLFVLLLQMKRRRNSYQLIEAAFLNETSVVRVALWSVFTPDEVFINTLFGESHWNVYCCRRGLFIKDVRGPIFTRVFKRDQQPVFFNTSVPISEWFTVYRFTYWLHNGFPCFVLAVVERACINT